MSAKTNYLETQLINAALKNTGFTGPATVYIALHTANPGETGATAEVAGNAYARQSIAFGAESGGQVQNSGTVTFPAPTPGNWGTVTHFSLWDAVSAGNCLYYGALTFSVATSVGVPVEFDPATVTIAET